MVGFFFRLKHGALGKSTSLRSLRVSTYSNLPDFNIPKIVGNLLNLQKLWISSPEPQKVMTVKDSKVTYKTISATDLRKEMSGQLPLKLREITISGNGFTGISETILKVKVHAKLLLSLLLLPQLMVMVVMMVAKETIVV